MHSPSVNKTSTIIPLSRTFQPELCDAHVLNRTAMPLSKQTPNVY